MVEMRRGWWIGTEEVEMEEEMEMDVERRWRWEWWCGWSEKGVVERVGGRDGDGCGEEVEMGVEMGVERRWRWEWCWIWRNGPSEIKLSEL